MKVIGTSRPRRLSRLHIQWLPYEARRLGRSGLGLPVLVGLLFAALAAAMVFAGAEERQVARVLVAYLEMGLPLAAGLAAATVISDEPAVDLQLALLTRYRTTVLRRLGTLVLWASLLALLWSAFLSFSGLWKLWVPENFVAGQLVWLSPLLWCVAAGALLSLVLGRTAAGAILGGLWLFEGFVYVLFIAKEWLRPVFLFATVYAPGVEWWLENRLALIGISFVFVAVLVVVLRSESVTKGES